MKKEYFTNIPLFNTCQFNYQLSIINYPLSYA